MDASVGPAASAPRISLALAEQHTGACRAGVRIGRRRGVTVAASSSTADRNGGPAAQLSANPQSRIGELEFELRSSTLRERSQLGVSFARAGALYKRGMSRSRPRGATVATCA